MQGFVMTARDVLYANISAAAFRVYAALKDHAGQKGVCWPSLGRLARLLHSGLTSVRNAIRELVDAGLVSVEAKPGTSSNYRVYDPSEQPRQQELFGPTMRVITGAAKRATPPVSDSTPSPKPHTNEIQELDKGGGQPTPLSRTRQDEHPDVSAVMDNYQRLFPESRAPNTRKRLAELRSSLSELANHCVLHPLRAAMAMAEASTDAAERERDKGRVEFNGLNGVDAALAAVLRDVGVCRRKRVA